MMRQVGDLPAARFD